MTWLWSSECVHVTFLSFAQVQSLYSSPSLTFFFFSYKWFVSYIHNSGNVIMARRRKVMRNFSYIHTISLMNSYIPPVCFLEKLGDFKNSILVGLFFFKKVRVLAEKKSYNSKSPIFFFSYTRDVKNLFLLHILNFNWRRAKFVIPLFFMTKKNERNILQPKKESLQ